MTRPFQVRMMLAAGLTAGLGLAAATPALAGPTRTFSADYSATLSNLPLGNAHFSLKPGKHDGCYIYTGHATPNSVVKQFFGDIQDQSQFCIVDGTIRPRHFKHHIGGKPKDSYTLDFDWSKKTVRYADEAGHHDTYRLKPGTQDPMSLQIAARLWLAATDTKKLPASHRFVLADDGGVGSYRIQVSHAGKLKTPAGRFDTAKITGKSDHYQGLTLWVAPDADWIPVQIRQQGKGDIFYTLTIQSLSRGKDPNSQSSSS